MTTFDDREKAQEAKFAHDAELRFKAEARRNRLLGEWAAKQLGLDDPKTYVAEVIAADFQEGGDEDIFRKIRDDFAAKNVGITDVQIRQKMGELEAIAREQIISEG